MVRWLSSMLACLVWTFVMATACSTSDDNGQDAATDTAQMDTTADTGPTAQAQMTFVDYNMAQAVGYVSHAEERLPLSLEALGALQADVVCVQEVWDADTVQAVVDGAKEDFPYAYYELTSDPGGGTGCTAEETKPLEDCVAEHCAEVDPADIADCALANCGTEFMSVSAECQQCIAANLGKPVTEIFEICVGGTGGGTLYFDGLNGVLLLSALELQNTSFEMLEAYLFNRLVLHATVEKPGLGTVHVFCTHLSTPVGGVQYNGTLGSWEEEQAAQIDHLLSWADEQGGANLKVVMGDMNCGPAKGDSEGIYEENFNKFEAAGWTLPYIDQADPLCTFCADNPLMTEDLSSRIIDHIALKSAPEGASFQAQRVLDQPVTIPSVSGEASLSDHYGVRVDVLK